MELELHRSNCCAFGECVATAPELFALGDDGLVTLLVTGAVPEGSEELARQAALSCPTEVIEVHE